jgi:hypothetical protein
MNFKDHYYIKLGQTQKRFREKVCERLQIKTRTFYLKLNGNSWTQLEREALDKIIKEEEEENV